MPREPIAQPSERQKRKMLVVSLAPGCCLGPQSDELGREAIEACQRGDREALGGFVSCYERRVWAYLSRTLGRTYPIEDLAQEVFLRAYPALARFKFEGTAKLSTWLLSIAHRVAVDARRRDRGRFDVLAPEHYVSLEPSPEARLHQDRLIQAVARATALLDPKQREVFVLATFHELSTAEIAEVVGTFEATVKTRLFRARARLRLALGTHFEVAP